MNSQIDNFSDCVRCEVADLVARLDVGRLMALRDFLSAWGYEPAPARVHQPEPVEKPKQEEKEPVAPAKKKRGPKPRVSDDELRELVADGLSDTEIARQFGVAPARVWHRRKKLGLSRNFRPGQKATKPKPKPRGLVVEESKPVPVKLKIPEPDADGVRHCPPGPTDDELRYDEYQFA